MSGWLKLHRQLKDWEWYDDINTSRLFIHCLIRANFKDTKWKGQEVLKGSFITSLDTLKQETSLTISQLRTAFSKLESTGEIEMKSQARSRTVTVIKYDLYQGDSKLNEDEINVKSQGNRDEIATGIELKNLRTKELKKSNSKNVPLDFTKWTQTPSPEILKDFLAMRKRKKHSVSQYFVNNSAKQIAAAIASGWSVDDCLSYWLANEYHGFKAEWMGLPHSIDNNGKFTPRGFNQ